MSSRFSAFSLLSILLLGSCTRPLEEGSYRAYVQLPEHGLTQTQQVGPVAVTCAYRPPDLLVAQELADTPAPPTQLVDSVRRSLVGRAYISLALAHNGAEIENRYLPDQAAFTQALSYLSTGIAADVQLSTPAADSVAALTALYPRQYGGTGRSTVLLVFDTRALDLSRGFTLTYRDTHFQLGTLRFRFAAADLAALPPLQF